LSSGLSSRVSFTTATATAAIYTLSLHDALPISGEEENIGRNVADRRFLGVADEIERVGDTGIFGDRLIGKIDLVGARVKPGILEDRKSTRLNSSHVKISYAVFCLKKTSTGVGTI